MPKVWNCIDCGAGVNRRVQRCTPCNSAFRSIQARYERTPETRARMSAAQKGRDNSHLIGKKRPEHSATMKAYWTPERRAAKAGEMRARMARPDVQMAASERFRGEQNPRWLGGLTATKYAPGFTFMLKARIRARDLYTCQLCGITEDELGYRLTIHHTDYDKTNHADANLASTCKACNSRVNTNRDYWQAHFAALAERRGELGEDVRHLVGRQVITQRVGLISIHEPDAPDLAELFAGIEPLSF